MRSLHRALLVIALAIVPAVASPPQETQRDVIKSWYCSYCFDQYRRECADCFAFWWDNDEMALRCLTGPREEFMQCIALCPLSPGTYGEILSLYDEGLLDSWQVVEAIQACE